MTQNNVLLQSFRFHQITVAEKCDTVDWNASWFLFFRQTYCSCVWQLVTAEVCFSFSFFNPLFWRSFLDGGLQKPHGDQKSAFTLTVPVVRLALLLCSCIVRQLPQRMPPPHLPPPTLTHPHTHTLCLSEMFWMMFRERSADTAATAV